MIGGRRRSHRHGRPAQVGANLRQALPGSRLQESPTCPPPPPPALGAAAPAGGAKILDGIGRELQLGESHLAPSRAVLHDYGNVSSSTTWYTFGFCETVEGVRRGDKLLQVRRVCSWGHSAPCVGGRHHR